MGRVRAGEGSDKEDPPFHADTRHASPVEDPPFHADTRHASPVEPTHHNKQHCVKLRDQRTVVDELIDKYEEKRQTTRVLAPARVRREYVCPQTWCLTYMQDYIHYT